MVGDDDDDDVDDAGNASGDLGFEWALRIRATARMAAELAWTFWCPR